MESGRHEVRASRIALHFIRATGLINVTPRETRVAMVENGVLQRVAWDEWLQLCLLMAGVQLFRPVAV